jgi:hypothetical protein
VRSLEERNWKSFEDTVKKDFNAAAPVIMQSLTPALTLANKFIRDRELEERNWNSFENAVKKDFNAAAPVVMESLTPALKLTNELIPAAAKVAREVDERSWKNFENHVEKLKAETEADLKKNAPTILKAAAPAVDIARKLLPEA